MRGKTCEISSDFTSPWLWQVWAQTWWFLLHCTWDLRAGAGQGESCTSHQGFNPGSSFRTVILTGRAEVFLSVLLFKKGMWAAAEPCGRRGAAGSAARTPAGTRGRSEHFKMLLNTSPRAYFIAFPKPGIKHGVYRMSPAATLLMHSCKSPS